ncbi:MAG: putative-Protein [Berkelbacteria bacterium GW2011_GWA2_38_9]|uniref:Putative-Protein n=1 Tax=Berkelbacteria bacterium GW2011_GWA2_38_9 TaxID=1618334 RepID=A0A0G0PBJ7_9BACT|nr:MAG: putative-Protein [Berkelbacteria bacterium GW2011_GWA2_38_9]
MTAVAAPTSATDQRGQSAKALTFDGASQYLTNTTADFRSADSAGSMSAWIKWTGSAQSAVFSSADTATADYYFKWNILGSANNYVIYIAQKNNDTADEIKGSTPLNDSLWHLATVTSSGSAWKLYIDGVAETITLVAGANSGDWFADTPNRDNLNIGVTKTSAIGSYFNGTIADYKIWNRELSATEVATLYRMYNPKTSTGSLKKGLVGQWDMAQTSLMSSTVIKDKTPGSYNGTYTGTMTAAVDRHNQSNKSIDFDGSTNYMTISNFYNNLSITGNWSVSAWFKFDSVSSNQALFSSSASSSNRMQIYFNDGLDILSGSIYNGSVITSKSVSFTDTTSWHHTVFTNTNTTTTAYLDNILLTDTTQSMNAEATATTIVGASQAAAAKFSGKISDIKVYNRVLSTTEVAALYNSY